MKHISTILISASLLLLAGCSRDYARHTQAKGKPLVQYTAELSYKDHFSANGSRLQTVGAIIKRDRENFHKYKTKDSLDRWGRFFNNPSDRDRLETIVNDGYVSPSARNIILNDYPVVSVRIYDGKNRGDIAVIDIIDDNERMSAVEDISTQYKKSGNCAEPSKCQ